MDACGQEFLHTCVNACVGRYCGSCQAHTDMRTDMSVSRAYIDGSTREVLVRVCAQLCEACSRKLDVLASK
eukprot:6206411-Pleurochrysis_carterae.AAC.1